MLHQKLIAHGPFLHDLSQLAYATELALDAASDIHVFREFYQARNLELHLNLELLDLCIEQFSTMAFFLPLDKPLRTFLQIHLQRYRHHFHLESIRNQDEPIGACL